MEIDVSGRSSICIAVAEPTQVGEARRTAGILCTEIQLPEVIAGKIGIIVSELATNLSKHTQGGEIILRPLVENDDRGIEVLSVDKGPGFDIEKCFRDGYSSSGTSGTGLGSVKRLATTFEVFSQPGAGSVSVAQLWDNLPRTNRRNLEVGLVSLPLKGEQRCGDSWATMQSGYKSRLLLVDGLGHGILAADAAQTAVRIFEQHTEGTPVQLLESMHQAMRSTRGGAVAIAEVDLDRRLVRFSGVGNISGLIHEGETKRNLISQNGTAGADISRVAEFQYPWPHNALLILCSDGLTTRWRIEDYPGLQAHHPSIIAGVLYRDFQRGRDDVTVLVARESAV